jgi:hypothetical protein
MYNTKDITTPKDEDRVYKDYYWYCKEGDPKQSLFWLDVPQCNRNKRILEIHKESGPQKTFIEEGKFEIVFIELAYAPQINFKT